ncbi:hypothetical protein MSG28_015703 [Choristoneura fumiferana]|uniref:Uncharacterized protein n=1 Tax=Choristoneura fumiferana TaxID=7141 RepID=A0ACC0KB67_CHOFU|nr:hypothetical protein MSG28_015703 [Choristoneura fumiferana]
MAFQEKFSPHLKPIYVPLPGTGLLSEREGLGRSSHAGPVRIENFTHTIELLSRLTVQSSKLNYVPGYDEWDVNMTLVAQRFYPSNRHFTGATAIF